MIGRIKTVNNAYLQAQKRQDLETMASLRAEGAQLTDQNLKAFAYAQKHLLGLMYERPIVPHEAPQENIQLCRDIIACLETGDVATAVDEYAWTVNNVLEWYAMYFSPEVIAVQDDMLWGPDNQENLYWGTNIGFAKADVDAATRSIFARYDEVDGDFFPGDCRLSSRHSGAASDPPGPGDRRNRDHDRAGPTAGLTITGTRQIP